MRCYDWENGYLSSRVNANLLQSGVSKLVYTPNLAPRSLFHSLHKSLETAKTIHRILVDDH
jgi:hypothetical protein